jgi:cytochrome d ubiquinol oxidase subunit I
MAVSLAFHYIFLCRDGNAFFNGFFSLQISKTNNEIYKGLTKAWSKGVAILLLQVLFLVPCCLLNSGLLFPKFMKHAGAYFWDAFFIRRNRFFIEAIALGFFFVWLG